MSVPYGFNYLWIFSGGAESFLGKYIQTNSKPGHIKVSQRRIGLHEADNFLREFKKYNLLLEKIGYKGDVYVDLRDLDELDSAGLAVLLEAEAIKLDEGRVLKLQNLRKNTKAKRSIEVNGLSRLFARPGRWKKRILSVVRH